VRGENKFIGYFLGCGGFTGGFVGAGVGFLPASIRALCIIFSPK
jgi:hypothetical protein